MKSLLKVYLKIKMEEIIMYVIPKVLKDPKSRIKFDEIALSCIIYIFEKAIEKLLKCGVSQVLWNYLVICQTVLFDLFHCFIGNQYGCEFF